MAFKKSVLALLVLVASVNPHPFGIGIELGGKSRLGADGNAGGKLGAGMDGGLSVGANGAGEVHGFWDKLLYGKVYAGTNSGSGIGLTGTVGSSMDGVINGTVGVGGDTNIISSNVGGRTGLDADGQYKAGASVNFMDKDELAKSARTFKLSDNGHNDYIGDETYNQPKYKKWLS